MSARDQLNAAYALGSFALAALVGAMFQSWIVFLVAACLFIGLCLIGRTIRPQ